MSMRWSQMAAAITVVWLLSTRFRQRANGCLSSVPTSVEQVAHKGYFLSLRMDARLSPGTFDALVELADKVEMEPSYVS